MSKGYAASHKDVCVEETVGAALRRPPGVYAGISYRAGAATAPLRFMAFVGRIHIYPSLINNDMVK